MVVLLMGVDVLNSRFWKRMEQFGRVVKGRSVVVR